jgi:hypothetical protein
MAHEKTSSKIKFCTTRGEPCKCTTPNKYRSASNPHWKSHTGAGELPYEAHHLLCCASVKSKLAKKHGIQTIVNETKWCINRKHNMIALPLWGHTIKWYGAAFKATEEAPPFKSLPQHNWDHNGSASYRTDVETDLESLADDISEAKEAHKKSPQKLAGRLNRLSTKYRQLVRKRGKRRRGTHGQLCREKEPDFWYEPFSMADAPTKKGYIKRGGAFRRIRNKVQALLG